jgi:hypothetical protein
MPAVPAWIGLCRRDGIARHGLLIDEHGRVGKVTFRHSVDGYELSCDGHALAVWGKPLALNASNAQDSDLTIVAMAQVAGTARKPS